MILNFYESMQMSYKTLNYLIKVTATYEQPKISDKNKFHQLVNEFIQLNFYPKIQEEQTYKINIDGGQPEKQINHVISFVSSDSQWVINFPREGIEIVYNSGLSESSQEVEEKEFLESAFKYIGLLISLVDVKKYIRIGFVSNKYNDQYDLEHISSIFTDFEEENTLERQNNIITRVIEDDLFFNVIKNQGYYKEGRINYIGGIKDFCGTTLMSDINTDLKNCENIELDKIKKSVQKIALGE